MGSRGSRTYSAPRMTPTSPFGTAPIQRSMTPRGYSQPYQRSPGMFGGGFGRGLYGGLLGGFLGAGLFGLLFGHGFFGGIGGGSSFLGLLLQLGLIYFVVRFALNYFRNRQQPVYGGPQGSSYVGAGPQPGGYGRMGGFGGSGDAPIAIEAADYSTFERRLGEVQTAYGAEDLDRLHRLATPEMVGYFNEELQGNAHRGVVNRLSGTRLLKGDLAEAWREGGAEYATVALRYELVDTMVDRASGRIVSGDLNRPEAVTELWTFVRAAGAGSDAWMLSAIQQTGEA